MPPKTTRVDWRVTESIAQPPALRHMLWAATFQSLHIVAEQLCPARTGARRSVGAASGAACVLGLGSVHRCVADQDGRLPGIVVVDIAVGNLDLDLGLVAAGS